MQWVRRIVRVVPNIYLTDVKYILILKMGPSTFATYHIIPKNSINFKIYQE